MPANCYQITYEPAAREIAAINAQIQELTRRKQLLEKLLEPLALLVPPSDSPISVAASNGSMAEIPASGAGTEAPPLVVLLESRVVESGPFEAAAFMAPPESEETDVHENGTSRSISSEDVADLAYRFWNERGQAHGHHEEDWFRAALELQTSASSALHF